jgi:hypothetical protein
MMNTTKQIVLYDSNRDDEPGELLVPFIAWLGWLLGQVPEEFRDKARIEMDAGDGYLQMQIVYSRPMTLEEFQVASVEEHDRLERLKKALRLELDELEKGDGS